MKIGYARVSTSHQNLEGQVDALKAAGCKKIFSEKQSGKTRKRPELERLIEQLRAGDVLVVTKLDRLARSLADLVSIMDELQASDVGFQSLGESLDLSTPAGRMQMQLFGMIAEFNRSLIVERTQEGVERARAQGRRPGRKRALSDLQERELYERSLRGDLPVKDVASIYGVSPATAKRIIARYRRADA